MANEMNAPSQEGKVQLKQDAIGIPGIVFFVVAAAAPLTVVVGLPGLIFGFTGSTAGALAFVVSGIVLLLFSVGYATMSNHLSGPGGFAIYAEMAFGQRVGGAVAYIALLGYALFLIALLAFFGYLAAPAFKGIGLELPWWIWTFIVIGVLGLIGYRAIDVSAKVLSVLLLCEMTITLIMDVAILVHGGQGGITAATSASFSATQLFGHAPGIVLLFAMASFVGIEATTLYGEEARDRYKTIPLSTYIAVVVIMCFYVFTFWMLGDAYGSNVVHAAVHSPGTFTFDAARRYVGGWAGDAMNWLVLSSVFACVLAFHNGIARYIFALGRSGLITRGLGKAHTNHESPHLASIVTSLLSFVIVGLYALMGANPYTDMYGRLAGFGTVAMMVLYASVSASVIGYLYVKGIDRRLWHSLISPILGGAGLILMIYFAIANFSVLTGSKNELVNLLWLLPFIAGAIGYCVAVLRSDSQPLADVPQPPLSDVSDIEANISDA